MNSILFFTASAEPAIVMRPIIQENSPTNRLIAMPDVLSQKKENTIDEMMVSNEQATEIFI